MDDEAPNRLRLRLYVDRTAPETAVVERNLRRLFDRVGMQYDVDVRDVDEFAADAESDRITLTPTLMRMSPPPALRVAGDLSDLETALDGLGLRIWEMQLPDGDAGDPHPDLG